jgi:hypothetical protein
MLKIKIKSGKGSQQDNSHHYNNDGYDEYGEYVGHQGYQDTEPSYSECRVCGSEILNSHLVFSTRSSSHAIHTSCLITSMALISNGIALVAGFFKRKKTKKAQIEGRTE